MDSHETIDRCKRMLDQFPNNELVRFSLGKAYFDAGEIGSAKEHLEFALTRKPDWMVVQILIGKCELGLGNRAAAKAAFERARQLAIKQHHEGPQAEMEELLRELE